MKKKKKVGSKFDESKPPVAQLLHQFPRAIAYLSKVSEYGHNKYGKEENNETWDNWKHVENKKFRYEQALGRHFLELSDHLDESGFYSISHTVWNGLAILETIIEDNESKQESKVVKKKKSTKKKNRK